MRRFYERAHGAGRDGLHRRNAKLRALPGRGVLCGAPPRRGNALPRAAGEKTAPDRKPAGAAPALRRYCRRAEARRHGASRLDVGAAERSFAGRAGRRRALRRGGTHFQPRGVAHARIYRPLQGEASGLCLGDESRTRSARHAHGVPVLPKKTGGDGILNICVFGAARDEIGENFMALGTALGRELAARGHTLVFGAGGHGMMGAAARGAYEMGGEIIGVVPYFFNTPGILFEHCTELIRMETMAERKTIMEERSDAFIALPGGIGTMEEIFEVITLSSLGRMQKKSAFLDAESYWEPAVELLRGAVEKGFAGKELNEHYARFTDVEACLDYLEK